MEHIVQTAATAAAHPAPPTRGPAVERALADRVEETARAEAIAASAPKPAVKPAVKAEPAAAAALAWAVARRVVDDTERAFGLTASHAQDGAAQAERVLAERLETAYASSPVPLPSRPAAAAEVRAGARACRDCCICVRLCG